MYMYIYMCKIWPHWGFSGMQKVWKLENCWGRQFVSFWACNLLTPAWPHKSGLGPEYFLTERYEAPQPVWGISPCFEVSFPFLGLMCASLFCLRVCITWPSGMPQLSVFQTPQGRNWDPLLSGEEGWMQTITLHRFWEETPPALGAQDPLLKLMLLCLLSGSKSCII